MIASSFTDPVLGIDVHFEMVPTPAPVPTPIPNPFTGIVFDPVGLAAGLALSNAMGMAMGGGFKGPVLYWGAFPATNTGTEAKHVPGHILIPPGVSWAPFPKTPKPVVRPNETPTPGLPVKPEDDAIVVFGSKTVSVMGSNAVRLGDIAMSCSEPLRLPSSVVLAVPKGAPILIGGPMSLDIMAAVLASLRTRFVSDSLHALVSRLSPGRFRNFLNRAVCFFTGHPVDVASGRVMTDFVDLSLPGPIPLRVERIYSSAFANRRGPLGHGWSFSLDQALWRERGKIVVLAEDGREIEFDTFDLPRHRIVPGREIFHPIEHLKLRCTGATTWQVENRDGEVRDYAEVPGRGDGRAMLQRIRTRVHAIEFFYDAKGALHRVRDSGGREIVLQHDTKGRVTALVVPHPSGEGSYCHRRYHYDACGDLVDVVDALNNAWKFEYQSHLLTRETDRTGISFYFAYDGIGADSWCIRTWGDGGVHDRTLVYDKKNHVTFVTDALGHATTYFMNGIGLVVKIVDPLGAETRYDYEPSTLRRTGVTDALGKTTTTTYAAHGGLTRQILPDGTTWTGEYDEAGRLLGATDGLGGVWRWHYDAVGQLVARVDPQGLVHRITYTNGLVERITAPTGVSTTTTYDSGGNARSVSSERGTFVAEYDALGRVVATRSAGGAVRRLRYDLEGNLVEVILPHGNRRHLRYDAEGFVVELSDATQRQTLHYSGYHRLSRRERANASVQMRYDLEGRLVAVDDGSGQGHRFELDAAGRIAAQTSFDGRTTAYRRGPTGLVTRVERNNGRHVDVTCDDAGRIVELKRTDGTFHRIAYRADGLVVQVENEAATVSIARDIRGRVVRETTGDAWVEARHDLDGALVALTTSEGLAVDLTRDAARDVRRIAATMPAQTRGESAQWAVDLARDADGAISAASCAGAVDQAWRRDGFGRTVHWTAKGRTARRSFMRKYDWEGDANLVARQDEHGETRFAYDAAGALVGAERANARTVRALDRAGNVYRRPDLRDRRYGPGGRLIASERGEYTYDDEGRRIEHRYGNARVRYTWDDADALRTVELPTGDVIHYAYDGMGRRLRKSTMRGAELVSETQWIWHGHTIIHETRSGEEPIGWVFGQESFAPMAKLQGSQAWSVANDQLGVPIAMFDAQGNAPWQQALDIYGTAEVEGDPSACPFRWPGQYFDAETGLHYNRWRYYDPATCGYLSPDPLGLHGGVRPTGYPLNPLAFADPFGLIDPWDILFSQDSIGSTFTDGPWAGRTLEEAVAVTRDLGHLPEGLELNVMRLNDEWVTLNNRTLFVVQQANLPQIHPNDVGPRGINTLNKLLDGHGPLPAGTQPEVRRPCS